MGGTRGRRYYTSQTHAFPTRLGYFRASQNPCRVSLQRASPYRRRLPSVNTRDRIGIQRGHRLIKWRSVLAIKLRFRGVVAYLEEVGNVLQVIQALFLGRLGGSDGIFVRNPR